MNLLTAILCIWIAFNVGFVLGATWHSMFPKRSEDQ
jgi:hypothetical protein